MSSMPYDRVVVWCQSMRPDSWSYLGMPTPEHGEVEGQQVCVRP
jgi:hypothetical protein